MLSRIALLQADETWRQRLLAQAVGGDFEVEYFESAERLYEDLSDEPTDSELVVLGVGVPDPIRTAQHVHGIDENLEILILCDEDRYPQLKPILNISPFLGSQVRCRRELPGDALTSELLIAAGRTRGRRRHHAWLAAAQRSLSAAEPPNRTVQVLDRLLDQAPIGVMLVAVDGRIVACNKMIDRLMGIQEHEVLGVPFADVFPGLAQQPVAELLGRAASDGSPMTWETAGTRIPGDGERYFRMNGSIVSARGNQRLLLVLLEDITNAKRRELALQKSQSEFRDVAGRLLTAQEDERARLAGELHDDLTQRMAMLAVEVHRLQRAADHPSSMREGLGQLAERLAQLSADIQSMSHRLHPSILSHLGLADAIAAECERLSTLEGIVIEFDPGSLPCSIPKDVSLCIYRIVQEALRNVVKHSGAKQAHVALLGTPDGVKLSIRDSGVGFDPEHSDQRPGLGLISMRERARLVQARMILHSRPGEGTTIEFLVPLTGNNPANA